MAPGRRWPNSEGQLGPHVPVWVEDEVTGEHGRVGVRGRWRQGFSRCVHFPGKPWLGPWSLSQPGHTQLSQPSDDWGDLSVTFQPWYFWDKFSRHSVLKHEAGYLIRPGRFLLCEENNPLGKRVIG